MNEIQKGLIQLWFVCLTAVFFPNAQAMIGSVFGHVYVEPPPPEQQPIKPRWFNESIDAVIAQGDPICPSARLIGRCVDVPLGNEVRHGNVYEDCEGRLVLVYHAKTR